MLYRLLKLSSPSQRSEFSWLCSSFRLLNFTACLQETAKLEAENFVQLQKVTLAAELKSVLDSWVRYEQHVKESEQADLTKTVIEKVVAALKDERTQKDILTSAIAEVERTCFLSLSCFEGQQTDIPPFRTRQEQGYLSLVSRLFVVLNTNRSTLFHHQIDLANESNRKVSRLIFEICSSTCGQHNSIYHFPVFFYFPFMRSHLLNLYYKFVQVTRFIAEFMSVRLAPDILKFSPH